MNLLVVSHACVTPINQAFFAEVRHQTAWSVTIVLPANWRNDYWKLSHVEPWPTFDGTLVPIPVSLPGNVPLHVYRAHFLRLLRSLQPDAIFVHHEPYGLATAQIFLANRFTHSRPIGFYAAQNVAKHYPLPVRAARESVYRQSAFAFPVSVDALEILRSTGYRGPATVLPLGFDPSLFNEHATELRQVTSLRQKPNDVIVGFLGRLAEEKGLATLITALAMVPELPWRLVLAGSGPFKNVIAAQAESLGISHRITYLGYVPHDEAPSFLSSIDILVLPSETRKHWKEQFGRVVLEALACGTPVLGSDSGEIPNLILATGGGRVFSEANAASLAIALRELLPDADARRELARTGGPVARANYSNATLAREFADVIDDSIR